MEDTADIVSIHSDALSALKGQNPDFQVWPTFGALKRIPKKMQSTPEFLEARIATTVVGRARPTQTMRAIDTLRKLREQSGQEELFFDFADLISGYLGDVQLTWHGYKKETFAHWDHAPIWSELSATLQSVCDLGHDVFLHSGTLLGLVRDKKLIDHDDDIDVAVLLRATDAVAAAAEWSALEKELTDAGLMDLQTRSERGPETFSLNRANGILVDLMPCWFEDDRAQIFPHTAGELTRDQVLPLVTCAISGLPIPSQPEAMLEVNYGKGWRRPDPLFVFPHVERRAFYKEFLAELGA